MVTHLKRMSQVVCCAVIVTSFLGCRERSYNDAKPKHLGWSDGLEEKKIVCEMYGGIDSDSGYDLGLSCINECDEKGNAKGELGSTFQVKNDTKFVAASARVKLIGGKEITGVLLFNDIPNEMVGEANKYLKVQLNDVGGNTLFKNFVDLNARDSEGSSLIPIDKLKGMIASSYPKEILDPEQVEKGSWMLSPSKDRSPPIVVMTPGFSGYSLADPNKPVVKVKVTCGNSYLQAGNTNPKYKYVLNSTYYSKSLQDYTDSKNQKK